MPENQVNRWFTETLSSKWTLLFLLFLFLTLFNINKAFHIDDTFHLEAAEWIRHNPGRPMSGMINWGDVPTPMYMHNQPPLFFYLIALFATLAGYNEIWLHLLIAVFTFLSLLFFQKLTLLLKIKQPGYFLALFAFIPAFVINQNLMTDVPILSLILASAYHLIKAARSGKTAQYMTAAAFAGTGILIKYSLLPILVVLLIVIIARKNYRALVSLLLPIGMLTVWSVWNYWEYGSVHFFDRPKGEIHINHIWSFMAGIGAVSTFTFSLLYGISKSRFSRRAIIIALVSFAISVVLFSFDLLPQGPYSKVLNVLFILNGFLVFTAVFMQMGREVRNSGLQSFLESESFIVFLFLGALSAFIAIFAPFTATRHILLILPFVLMFCSRWIENSGIKVRRISLVSGIILSVLLGVSDWQYADYYRKKAKAISLPENVSVWFAGHWGWQWYATERGMKPYAYEESVILVGDYLIYPGDISRQRISEDIELRLIGKEWEEAGLLTLFSGKTFASLYNSAVNRPPWNLSKQPIDTIYIWEVRRLKMNSP